jgi:hypothetical protein
MSTVRQNSQLFSANVAVHAGTADASSGEVHVGGLFGTSQILGWARSTLSYPSLRGAAIAVTSWPSSTSQKSREKFTEHVMAREVGRARLC